MKQKPVFMALTIGLGNGASAGITEDNEVMINASDTDTRVLNQISLGKINKRQLDNICGYIQRLRIHLPD